MKNNGEVKSLKEFKQEIDMDKKVEESFLFPLGDLLLQLKLVEKDKRRLKTPYLKAEIIIPHKVATSIKEYFNSGWKLCILGVKTADGKK